MFNHYNTYRRLGWGRRRAVLLTIFSTIDDAFDFMRRS